MKGLLIKDILNMKNYMKQLVLVLIFFIAYGIFLKNGTFVGTMITLMLSMQVITTMSYDEYAKWDKYALTMNINRKDIIISKYIFFTISIIILFVLLTHLNNKKIIVEDSYINWAGGFSYEGTVICDDGSIYKFSMNDKKDKYEKSYEDLKKLNIAILNNKTKYGKA